MGQTKQVICILFCMLLFGNAIAFAGDNYDINPVTEWAEPANTQTQRIIVDNVDGIQPKSINIPAGCTVRHSLEGATSYDCPAGTSFGRPAMVFHPLDIRSDTYIGADKVWNAGFKGSGQTVIIIDTGIDARHNELQGSVVGQYDFVNNDGTAEDGYGHGTMVTSIITGNGGIKFNGIDAKGVAPDAGVYMLKVCDNAGRCDEDDILAAMEFAATISGKIVSISLGGGEYSGHCDNLLIAQKLNWLVDQGKILVVAAGNSGKGISAPGCASKAIAVGATDLDGNMAWYSSRGSGVEIFAPGDNIVTAVSCLVTGYCNMNDYSYASGTSAATPHVSGAIALLLNAKNSATASQIKDAIFSTVTPIIQCYHCTSITNGNCIGKSLGACTSTEKNGAGILNVYQAYNKMNGGSGKDTDKDGVPDTTDLCPTTYGKGCNGCPNPCSGCAQMQCQAGKKPTCTAGACSATACSSDGCGRGGCSTDKWGDFPSSVANTCKLTGNTGQCSKNVCKATCTTDTRCQPQTKCWSASYEKLPRSSSQMQKFCSCVTGRYAYKSYTSKEGRTTATLYASYKENHDWSVITQTTSYSVTKVVCQNGKEYATNQDYYHV